MFGDFGVGHARIEPEGHYFSRTCVDTFEPLECRFQRQQILYGNRAGFRPRRIFQTQTVFDFAGNVLSSGPLASTTGKLIDPDIKPIYSDEWLAGYATPLGEGYSLDVFFMSGAMNNFIEDLPSRLNSPAPDGGPFIAANLPCARFAACLELPRARRQSPQPHVDESRSDGELPGASERRRRGVARGSLVERLRQPGAACHRLTAVP